MDSLTKQNSEIVPVNKKDRPVTILMRKVRRSGIYKNRIKLDCIGYVSEKITTSYSEYAVREIHGGKCPGDPNTGPVVDRFRVMHKSKKVLWLHPIDARYVEFNRIHEFYKSLK